LSTQARRSLVDDYSNSRKFSDGTIFRKIIEYETSDNYSKQHWWSWLTDCKKDILCRIFSHLEFNAALRQLYQVPALLEDLNITVWHKIIATRSDEEFLHYISLILATFDYICIKQKRLLIALDRETVRHLQSRCPGTSLSDLKHLEHLVHKKQIFPNVDDATRQEIWKRLRNTKYLIPTLGSLQHDFKYIRGPAVALHRLLSPTGSRRQHRKTLRDLAELAFSAPQLREKVTIQITNDSTQEITGDEHDQFEIGFQQLYLFAMRESWSLVNDCPLKEPAREKPLPKSPDPIVWHNFAKLAYTLGFKSTEVQRLKQINPFQEKARQVLLDKHEWSCEDALIQRLLTDTEQLYRMMSQNTSSLKNEPQMLTHGPGEPVKRRRGRCYENAYDRDKQHMFIKTLLQPVDGYADSVTSLFVRKSVHQAFFPSWKIAREAPIVSEPKEDVNSNRTEEQTDDVDMRDAAASSPKEGTDGVMARQQNGDTDMIDTTAVSRSSQRGDRVDGFPYLHAGSTKTPQEGNPIMNEEVRGGLAIAMNTASTGLINESSQKRSFAHSNTAAGTLPPAPPLALQLVRATDARLSTTKRTRTDNDRGNIKDRNGSEHATGANTQVVARRGSTSSIPPTNALTTAPSLDLQLVSPGNTHDWARKRPRTGDYVGTIRNKNGNGYESTLKLQRPSDFHRHLRGRHSPLNYGKSIWGDTHPQISSSVEVTVWTDFDGEWEEVQNSRCNSSEQVQEVIGKLQAERECWPATKEGRGLMASECYEIATQPGGDYRVYVTKYEEL
ncbi:hypothetical protein COCMIDRAFT_31295, partial [Bipolaris oryzae ATCC 44560]